MHYATISELAAALRTGETTPTELTRTYLDRLDTTGRRLNAVVTLTEERAMREAQLAEAELAAGFDRGPLHGIPYGVKDLVATQDYPTSWGAAPYRDQTFDHDGHVVGKLQAAGGVLVAKLAMIELAGGMGYEQPNASFTGPCKTPWNEDAWSGGSSSGSGSAVAAGLVGYAIGSETQGSIHSPANNCGVSGLRPTYGRVSRRGAMALSWTMDKLGPLCRSAEDCGLVLDAIAGHDSGDPTSVQRSYRYSPNVPGKRDGFTFGILEGELGDLQPEVQANFEQSIKELEAIGTVETVSLPDLPYREVAEAIIRSEMISAFEELIVSGRIRELAAVETHVNALSALTIPAHVYLRALRMRRHICEALDHLLAGYDAVLSPTMPTVASPLGMKFDAYYERKKRGQLGSAANVAGIPGIAVPNGFGERGLPTSICFTGRAFSENTILAAATAYQARTGWHLEHPGI
jgi:aspartyl-tRNA(Asn)/glutamyl-tRNA(Gln) amidotransferase subunit A